MADPIVRRGAARGWSALAADPRALARALDDAPYPAWIHEIRDGYPCIAINAASAAAYDLDPIDLVGSTARDTMAVEDYAIFDDAMRELLEVGRPTSRRVQIVRGRVVGEQIPLNGEMVLTPIVDEHGEVTHVFGVARALTNETALTDETALTNETSRTSAERFRGVFEANPEAMVLVTSDGICLDANPAIGELVGVAGTELVGADLASFVGPDGDMSAAPGRWSWDDPPSGILTVHRGDGSRRIAEYRTVPHVQPDVHLVTARDITEQVEAAAALRAERDQQAEEIAALRRFRALVEKAPDMIAILDRDGCLVEANPSTTDTLGLDPSDLVGHSIFELIHPDDRDGIIERFRDGLARTGIARPGNDRAAEFRLAAGDGSWRVIQAVGSNLFHDPAVDGFVVNARDATERRRLEDQRAQARTLEAVGRLAGGIARPTVLDVHDVIKSMEVMLRQLLGPAVGLAVGGPGVPADVRGDRSQIEQVFLNLVVNARDACGPTGGQIVVRTEIVELPAADRVDPVDVPSGRYVVVSVRDDGAGMDPATQAHAFEPFFTTKDGKGTGLGLSIVHGIVNQSGGSLHVESAPGVGTTVRVYLPYVVDAHRDGDTGASEARPTRAPAPS